MFYAHFVLAKKGPLAKIWLAAHWDKKLTKAHVFETNIEKSVDGILKPKVKMALRTSGHLLLGVVRIYSRKAKYLLQDCNEAFVKIKMAFRPGMVDLPEEHREAAMNAITLPEVFHDFDTAMPELNEVDIEAQFSLNQSRAEEITMREDYGSLNLVTHDDGFGDMGFDTDHPDIMREAIGNDGGLGEQSNVLFADGSSLELAKEGDAAGASGSGPALTETHERRMEAAPHAPMDDGFGGTIADDFGADAGGLFEGDLFGDVSTSAAGAGATPGMPGTSQQPQSLQAEIDAGVIDAGAEGVAGPAASADAPDSDDDMGDHYDAGNSPQHSWGGSPAHDEPPLAPAPDLMPPPAAPRPPSVRPMDVDEPVIESAEAEAVPEPTPAPADNTTLLQNDEESFALAPVDATVLRGITKTKRKRKLIVDEVKNITGEEMKNQLSNTSDIVTTLDLAPPTRRLMHWKETGGVEKLFTLPARPIPSRVLFKKYSRNMTLRSEGEEVDPAARSPDPETPSAPRRGGRKRRHEESIQAVEPPVVSSTTDLEPPTPVPHEYEPSVGLLSSLGPPMTPGMLGVPLTPGTLLQGGLTPGGLNHGSLTPGSLQHGGLTPAGLQHGDQPVDLGLPGSMTPGGLHHGGMTPGLGLDSAMTPAGLQHAGMTPVGLEHGGMTPGGLQHGGMTPAGLQHGGMTPAHYSHGGMTPAGLTHGGMTPVGLHHGGMTPAGLTHGGMTPAGLTHGGMTPGGLQHGGMTPVGLQHGGMTPTGLQHGGMTPSGLQHGGMTPGGLQHEGMTPAGLHHGGMTPIGLQHGGMTPTGLQHGGMTPAGLAHGGQSGTQHPALLHGSMERAPMMPQISSQEPLLGLSDQYRDGMQMTNLGYDDNHAPHSPQHDYDLPATPENAEEGEREAGETDEQFEERVLNRRAAQLFAVMRPKLAAGLDLAFTELAPRHNNRKQVAQKFYSLLVLKKHQVLKLEQHETYGPITISKGSQFETEDI